jgi:quinol monooxygenase YgiN
MSATEPDLNGPRCATLGIGREEIDYPLMSGRRVITRMRLILVLAMVILPAMLWGPVYAQDNAVYLVTYFEVMPNAVASGAALLERYNGASRKEIGNLSFDVLHEMARPERFAILEVWKDKAARDGHDKAASALHFRDRLNEIQGAPYDERILSGLYLGPVKDEHKPGAIYVLTHVDVVPQHLNDGLALLGAMSVDTAKDNGNISYEVLQQANRLNHFTVVEEWTSKQALDAHATSPHTRAFRERLLPLAGALYDERFYRKLD